MIDDAYERGVLEENSVVYRDLFDTKLMGSLTPRPVQVMKKFQQLQEESSQRATDWYYQFSQDTNYIRKDRVAKDIRWKTVTEYGEIDISINQSKPEKDPKAIAADKKTNQLPIIHVACSARRMWDMPDDSIIRQDRITVLYQ